MDPGGSLSSAVRSGQGATQRGGIGWLAVRGERELDRQVEQRAELSDDVIARLVGATPELNLQACVESWRMSVAEHLPERWPRDS